MLSALPLFSLVVLSCFLGWACAKQPFLLGSLTAGAYTPNTFNNHSTDPYYVAQFTYLAQLFINNYTNILPDAYIDIMHFNTGGDETNGIIDALKLADTYNVHGVSGGTFSSEVVAEQLILKYFQVPQNSGTASSSLLSDKTEYPFFFRVYPPDSALSRGVLAIVENFGWDNIILVYSADDFGIGGRTTLLNLAQNKSINVNSIQVSASTTVFDYSSQIKQIRDAEVYIIVLFVQTVQGTAFLTQANASGLVGDRYVYICGSTLMYDYKSSNKLPAVGLLDGLIGIEPASGTGPLYEEVFSLWKTLDPKIWPGANSGKDPGYPAWYTFESLYVFAIGLAQMIANGATNVSAIAGKDYMETLMGLNYQGVTGTVLFDANGDRDAFYDVFNFVNKGTGLNHIGLIQPNGSLTMLPDQQFTFYGGSTNPPTDAIIHVTGITFIAKAAFYIMASLSGIGIVASFVFLIVILRVKDTNPINISEHFYVIMAVGAVIAYTTAVISGSSAILTDEPIGSQVKVNCLAKPWLFGLGYILLYGIVFAVSFWEWRSLIKVEQMTQTGQTQTPTQSSESTISWRKLYIVVLPLIITEVMLDTIWMEVDPLKPRLHNGATVYVSCSGKNDTAFQFISVFYKAALGVFGTYFSYKTRKRSTLSEYNSYCTYNTVFTGVVLFPIRFLVSSNPTASYVIESIGYFFGTSFLLIANMMPIMKSKFTYLFTDSKENQLFTVHPSPSQRSFSSNTSTGSGSGGSRGSSTASLLPPSTTAPA